MKRKIIIIGRIGTDDKGKNRGEFARIIAEGCQKAGIPHLRLAGAPFISENQELLPQEIPDDSIVVFVSSKARLPAVIEECQKRGLLLIVASSGITEADIPADVTIPVILAPNLAILIMILFDVFERMGKLVQKVQGTALVVEGHQEDKTSPPGTAQKIAGSFGNPPESVISIRKNDLARVVLGIPEGNLGGFGAHYVLASVHGIDVVVTFKTIGRSMYLPGLMFLLSEIETKSPLRGGVHHADKLLFGNIA